MSCSALRLPNPGVERTRVLIHTGCWTLGIFLLLTIPEWVMQQHGAGIVDFELAGTPGTAERILTDWGPDGRTAALVSLLLDFLFLLAYSSFFGLVCLAMADRLHKRGFPRLGDGGKKLAIGALAAAALDAIENVNLLIILWKGALTPFPQIAFAAAVVKFALIGAILVHFVVAVWVLNKARKLRKATGAH